MRQETGSKLSQATQRVSIQQSLDGHSFSAALAGSFPEEGPVEVEVLTPRTLLVPAALFDAARGRELLAANGMPLAPNEEVVHSSLQQDPVAVMALPAEALRLVTEKLGERAQFTTPLLGVPPTTAATVWLHQTAGLLYIKVYHGTLRFAEVLTAPSDADALYLVEQLAPVFPLAEYELRLTGEGTKSLGKQLKRHFKDLLCE